VVSRISRVQIRLPLLSDRLRLRFLKPSDASMLAQELGDRRVARPIHLPAGYSIRDARDFIRRSQRGREDGSKCNLLITLRATGELIGGCGLDRIRLDHRNAHVGYWIARRHWGHGYAPEAASLLVSAGFRQLGLHRVHTGVSPENPRSMRVLHRLGFRREGRAREDQVVGGRYRDLILFGLLRQEFRPYHPQGDRPTA
jgi:[ribosomal protein S5]-alanine N-acetyltransferase